VLGLYGLWQSYRGCEAAWLATASQRGTPGVRRNGLHDRRRTAIFPKSLRRSMFEHMLAVFHAKIRTLQYVMTLHAEEEMDNDGLSIFDIEQAILNGVMIERQKDRNSDEWKYVIQGRTDRGDDVVVVAKMNQTAVVVIITVYAL